MDGVKPCSEYEDLKKKIYHLEYEDMKEIRNDIQNVKEDMAKNHVLLKQSISSTEKLNETLATVQTTMIQLTESMKHNGEVTNALSQKVSNLENKIDRVESQNKLDMREWWQKNWVNVIMLLGVVVYIVLGQYVKI